MATFFLLIIYLAFISLGIPDSLLGVAWPVMQPEIGAPFESAGLLSMVIAGGTIVSSLLSGSVIRKLGTGKLTLVSCLMTAGALLGFSLAPSLLWLIALAIPLGLGGGAVDAGLNHYVAAHYKAHHMSWLHCFWGVGATLGPIIMSAHIAGDQSWRSGYMTVALIQFGLVVLLFVTLPLWKRVAALHHSAGEQVPAESGSDGEQGRREPANDGRHPLRMKGAKVTMLAFLFYCGAESTVGLWGASFLVGARHLSAETAATWISLYYGGITLGRFIAGFVTLTVSNRALILIGQLFALAGGLIVLFPLPGALTLTGFMLIGLGLAPIYPCLLHETPARFGKDQSAKLMGYQMAVAYTGTTVLPPLFGVIASGTSVAWFPAVVILFILSMLFGSESVNRAMKARQAGIGA
ncbi:MFS transporter [Paenibacillus arenilitoris]|uniref:MFS transporter n=1 Tax=Paenibacillus arenilitoris TaxID=2772299 RepID=A0A927H707_9BACL|nr:MFS transporter [Paenibacillus arenilitoris]MBD2871111.1 MFS transporter [Paenibacillus arenilitoris]